MSQQSQSSQQSNQSDIPEAPNDTTQDETEDASTINRPRPSPSVQEPPPQALSTFQASIKEPTSILHTRVSGQEPTSILHSRRVSIQEPTSILHSRRVSIQEPTPMLHTRRVSIQEPTPMLHTRRVSIQEPTSIFHIRRFSTQEPTSILNTRPFGVQETPLTSTSSQISTTSSSTNSQISLQDTSSSSTSSQMSLQEKPSVTYSSHLDTQDTPVFQTENSSVQTPWLTTPVPLSTTESVAHRSQVDFQEQPPSVKGSKVPIRARVTVPPSITHSPEASIQSIESILWYSEENFKESLHGSQFSKSSPDYNIYDTLSSTCLDASSSRFQAGKRRRKSQLPISRQLLKGAKKTSRQLSLVLSLAGMVIIGLVCLHQPWLEFQVPLTPPGNPAGPLTISINTVLFFKCPEISCQREQDKNALFLDITWALFVASSITSLCLCIVLIDIIFTRSNLPILDSSNVILSIQTGLSITLGVLFCLVQARVFLQKGMTYRLESSFYIAWISVFLFMMTGFFSCMNYMNFWSILALETTWT